MGFLLFPTGVDIDGQRRALWAWVMLAMLVYRALAGLFLPGTHAILLSYVPIEAASWELFAAFFQSSFSPPFPASLTLDAWAVQLLGVSVVILFWTVFPPALEDTMGAPVFAALVGLGLAGGLVIAAAPVFGISVAYWTGLVATLFLAGMALVVFWTHDVRVQWMFFWPLGIRFGVWKVPTVFFLVPMLVVMLLPQSLVFHPEGVTAALARHATIPPAAWGFLVAGLGGLAGWGWKSWDAARAERLGVPRRLKEKWN